ncbi:pro-resilin-like [Homarus americanus]|uniref:Pro-resilin-like 108 n=1 Tax=Homarus americanus TaxID=6706 RepID=A0A8J5TIP7_HOMAM|nr:pro-resilin-like [Homarus americanus]KAG7176069.1 Pro-resilin-like 108 [Homarus americanus]
MKVIVLLLSVAVLTLAKTQGKYDNPGPVVLGSERQGSSGQESVRQESGSVGSGGQGDLLTSATNNYGQQGVQFPSAPAQYNFQWDVNDSPSGNFYGHGEERNGDNTQGNYYVQLPDGRRLLVEYFADQTGYHPTVTYEGEATFPTGGGGGGSQQGYYQ